MSEPSYLSDPQSEAARAARVPFVSRSSPAPDEPVTSADGLPLPRLTEPAVLVLLAFVLTLQALSWWLLEGYQLADSVEYMERALTFARGEEMIDSKAIRSFGFSMLLVPVFAVWEALGIDDVRSTVSIIRIFQIALGLALVLTCARLGARVGGRRAGFAAGYLAGVNPIFLQYTVSPVSGIAAALFVALALEAFLERRSWRRSLAGGAWLGLAFLMAYQTVLILAPIVLLVLLRDRWRYRATWLAALAGIALAVVVQIGLDKLVYGACGASLSRYLLENVGYNAARIVHETDKVLDRVVPTDLGELARDIYRRTREAQGLEGPAAGAADAGPRQKQPVSFYLTELHRMLVWPVMLCGALGLLRSWKRPSWKTSILVLAFLANVAVMSVKGSKDFRLWLPLLPMIAPVCAFGWALVDGRAPWRRAFALGLLAAACALGLRSLLELNTRRFGVYWEAMDLIAAEVGRTRPEPEPGKEGERPRWRASAAYHFAMFLREPPNVELVKLPWNLDEWNSYPPEKKEEDFATIRTLDWFVTHLPVLQLDPELMRVFNAEFEVHSALFHRDVKRELGPIFVLERKRDARPRTFFEEYAQADPGTWRDREGLRGRRVDFLAQDGSGERLAFLGFEVEAIGGDGYSWISYHWYTPTGLSRDLKIIDRITSRDERNTWQNDHFGAYGVLPTSAWRAGAIVRESYLLIPAADPFDEGGLRRWVGGDYRRGDLVPAHLWIKLAEYGADGAETPARFAAARPEGDAPLRGPGSEHLLETSDGWRFSPDGLVRVGGFLLPTHPAARVPDDGRPIE
jgi:hypothetical protein